MSFEENGAYLITNVMASPNKNMPYFGGITNLLNIFAEVNPIKIIVKKQNRLLEQWRPPINSLKVEKHQSDKKTQFFC